MREVDSYRVAIDCVLPLLLSCQGLLLCLGLRLRDVGGLLWCIRAIAIDCSALCCGHGRRSGCLGSGGFLGCLKLLHGGGQLLLMLALLGIAACLLLLLRLTLLQGHLGSSLGLRLIPKNDAFQFFSYLFNLEGWGEQARL